MSDVRFRARGLTAVLLVCCVLAVGIALFIQERNQIETSRERILETQKKAEQDAAAQAAVQSMAEQKKATANEQREAALRAARQAVENDRQYVQRYLQSSKSIKTPGRKSLAVAVAGPNGELDRALAERVASLFPPARVKASTGVFTSAFGSDGLLRKVLGSGFHDVTRLDLPSVADSFWLATYRVEFSTNPELANFITARLHLDAGVIDGRSGVLVESVVEDVSGLASTRQASQSIAEERILGVLSTRRWAFLTR